VTGRSRDRFVWDATAALESLGGAGVVLWTWDPDRDSMRVTGPARSLGLGPLAPECSTPALLALAAPQDRALVEEFLTPKAAGDEAMARIRMRGGPVCVWRGDLPVMLIRDAGRTVVEAGTRTCFGIGPAPAEQIDPITADLKLVR